MEIDRIIFAAFDAAMNIGCWGMVMMFVVLGIDSLFRPHK